MEIIFIKIRQSFDRILEWGFTKKNRESRYNQNKLLVNLYYITSRKQNLDIKNDLH